MTNWMSDCESISNQYNDCNSIRALSRLLRRSRSDIQRRLLVSKYIHTEPLEGMTFNEAYRYVLKLRKIRSVLKRKR
jgi:hypothetical protein